MALPRPQISSYYYYPPSLSLLPPPPPPAGSRISPVVLFTIVILAVLFFISGLLHLLVRFLTKRSSSSSSNGYPEISTSEALQRQLQQLFHLHDSGLDQSFIDALPAFRYGEVVGPKQPFDCAVCLSEFSEDDMLRLLPPCCHAFHISCIDTWLLSNSTCPICRAALFSPGFPMENPVFEYDEDYPDEQDREAEIEDGGLDQKGVLQVKLGKFRKLDGVRKELSFDEASNSNLDARRCYSMGSYQYVVGNTNLRVALALCPDQIPRASKVARDSNSPVGGNSEGKKISIMSRGDSYSVSKIWLWQKKGGLPSSSGDVRIDLPSFNSELPWIDRKPNV